MTDTERREYWRELAASRDAVEYAILYQGEPVGREQETATPGQHKLYDPLIKRAIELLADRQRLRDVRTAAGAPL